jgi:hypothetical protein
MWHLMVVLLRAIILPARIEDKTSGDVEGVLGACHRSAYEPAR